MCHIREIGKYFERIAGILSRKKVVAIAKLGIKHLSACEEQ